MPNDTISLVLNGNVFVEDLATAVSGWFDLLKAIGSDVQGASNIRWVVDDVSPGSFFGTLRAEYKPEELPSVEQVVREYAQVGKAVKVGALTQYKYQIQTAAKRIVAVIDRSTTAGKRGVESVRFETPEDDTEIFSPRITQQLTRSDADSSASEVPRFNLQFPETVRASLGAVRGTVESLTRRTQLRFTLYEVNTDRAVSCYLQPGSESLMKEAWGKLVSVEGTVRRDPETGLATTVRQVRAVTIIAPIEPDSYKLALGCAPARPGSLSPEAAIRRLRDAQ